MKKTSLLLLFLSLSVSTSYGQASCLECHGAADLTRTLTSGVEQSLFVNDSLFLASVHGGMECRDCHKDAIGDPHPEKLKKAACADCHEDAVLLYAKGEHGRAFLSGDSAAPSCASCHSKHAIRSSTDSTSTTHITHLSKTCATCHDGNGAATSRNLTISNPAAKFEKGVHGKALAKGNLTAASCSSCHGSHELLPITDPLSPIHPNKLAATCGKCHEKASQDYELSSHGMALTRGVRESPTCNNCHGEHEILSSKDPRSGTSPSHISEKTCSPCHGILKLNEKYGLISDPVTSYRESYHGMASIGGSQVAANCVSCHGAHNVLPSTNPRSTIHAGNLQQTCGQCHVNVTAAFAKSYIHASPTSKTDRYSDVVKTMYIWMIVAVIGGMVIHNLIIYLSFVRAKYRALQLQETVRRFDRSWVIQHLLIFLSFTVLVITGFALKYTTGQSASLLAKIGFTEAVRGVAHRLAAVVLMTTGVYHIFYLLFSRSAKGELKSLLPNINDVRLFIVHMKHHLGLTSERAEFERYGYIEKAEYWALVWGTAVMAGTGFVLWFPALATMIFPVWIIKVSETIHYYEAILATLAILLYHMFFAIFHPSDYPINLTSFTGKITKEEAEERFPAWYRSLQQEAEKKENL
jgi:cytochrome b subunit of formate dehydrogenase